MKRRELERRLRAAGARKLREGAEHTIYESPRTGKLIAVPRHTEVPEPLAKKLLREV